MRLSVSALALIVAGAAHADEVMLRADVTAATVYLLGAELTRQAEVDLPAGTHRIYMAIPDLNWGQLPEVSVTGARMIGQPVPVEDQPLDEGVLDLPDQAAARIAVEQAEDAVEQIAEQIAASEVAIRSAEVQLAYLNAISTGGSEGIDMPGSAELLATLLTTLGAEMARASEELRTARVARQELHEDLIARQGDLDDANQALRRLKPFGDTVDMIAVDVTLEAAGDVVLTTHYLTDAAAWRPSYRLDLASETGALDITRSIVLEVDQTMIWRDVAVDFSTTDPIRRRSPRSVGPDPARLHEPLRPAPSLRDSAEMSIGAGIAAEPVVIVEEAAAPIEMISNGLALTYVYPTPVSIGEQSMITLPFDTLSFEADLTNLAIPRRDMTAFLMAEFENTSDEPILPGWARFYRDGAPLGEGELTLLPSGAETEMAFGPLDHLRLTWQDLSLDEGDRGIFVQSNTQDRQVSFTVENSSASAEEVRVLYATPFAEQEDLEVDVTLSPQPDERDIDDLRGVVAWDVTIAPGETQEFGMGVSFDWPEGQVLNWQP
ncbi:mucoidy inhibitor MuiA family protein [Rhodophyticola sp. CCM32]|uniref:DUF4139 domain-containing protein n=1 Tax=Rhodophyticola sp. CCM32 TaxID=2916397 RepID=UPI00107F22FE|nr:DUF4139 domain-containing protein [Rhodophyticola sp. CCM32]QBY01874.1 mucoidy inhibitor MuiA family protein [Rhodophyticola sp. CCM32]